jgi:hypothetical protein
MIHMFALLAHDKQYNLWYVPHVFSTFKEADKWVKTYQVDYPTISFEIRKAVYHD